MKNVVIIAIYIFFISLFIFFVKNEEEILKKISSKKYFGIIKVVFIIIFIVYSAFLIYKSVNKIVNNYSFYKFAEESKKMFELCDKKVYNENSFYKDLMKNNYLYEKEPYIPDGFEYIEGNKENGFIIQDNIGNEFVWIPVSKETLVKKNFSKVARVSCNYCYDERYEEFLKSALENCGFYISRYEIGNVDGNPVSMKNQAVYVDIDFAKAKELANQMYKENKLINCELLTGYAYDTTLEWLIQNKEFKIYDTDISKPVISGRKLINGVYDFTDNVFELTQERDYDVIVSRGYFVGDEAKMNSRYTVLENAKNIHDASTKLSFRVMLYK